MRATDKQKRQPTDPLLPEGVAAAPMARRLVSVVIDFLLAGGFACAVVLCAVTLYIIRTDIATRGDNNLLPITEVPNWFVLWIIALFYLYFIVGWTMRRGQTPGKQLTGLRVVQLATLLPPTPKKSLLRLGGYMLHGLLFPLLVLPFTNPERRGLHDLLAGTIVVQNDTLPKEKRKLKRKPKRKSTS